MTILVQSFLNSATRLSTTATTATTVAQLKTLVNVIEGVSTSVMAFYVINPSTTSTALVSGTLGSYGITTATTIYSSNTISTATNKVDRQLAKLELAQLRRQAGGDTSSTFYRSRNVYSIDLLADKYTSNTSTVGTTSTLTIGRPWISGLEFTSYTGDYSVAVGTFNYDSYGAGFSIRKDGGSIDAYINQVIALPTPPAREYTSKTFTYGEAQISFTLNANGTFNNVTCPYGAGGYSASSGQLTMLGTQLLGGVSPGNDILWDYVCAGNDGVITDFTYASGTPPIGRLWTFVPANGQPSFTRAMQAPVTNVELPGEIIPTWNIATAGGINLGGSGINELNSALTPIGTSFNIYVT